MPSKLVKLIVDYSAAPLLPEEADPRCQYLIAVELDGPCNAAAFGQALDTALEAPSFARWMERQGRLGAQNKVPRVVSGADTLAELLAT